MTPCATRSGSALPSDRLRTVGTTEPAAAGQGATNRSSCKAYMSKPGAKYTYVRDEHCCLSPPDAGTAAAHGLIPLYLMFATANNDHMLSPNKSFAHAGVRYGTYGPECYGYPTSAAEPLRGGVATAPLDIYWSMARKDMWSLSSDASRAQATSLGYVRLQQNVARVPTAC